MDPIASLIKHLHDEGRTRVWSLVITLFGDAVQHRGGLIATSEILRVFERLNIEAGTVRTALSRLSSDGWVRREREGRNSFYRLSATAAQSTQEASSHIYRAPMDDPQLWSLQVGGDPVRGFPLGENVWLVPGPPEGGIAVSGALSGHAEVGARAISQSHREVLNQLDKDLATPLGGIDDPLTALAARVLIIHRWRRIALRYPDIPPTLKLEDLPDPRTKLAHIYPKLFRMSEQCLALPLQDVPSLTRFGVDL